MNRRAARAPAAPPARTSSPAGPVRAGTAVLMSPYVTQRHPELWPDPESFDPDRFLPQHAAGRPRYAHYPFGGGPRRCIGIPLARLLGSIALAAITRRFRLLPGEGTVKPRTAAVLRPAGKVPVRLEPRTQEIRKG